MTVQLRKADILNAKALVRGTLIGRVDSIALTTLALIFLCALSSLLWPATGAFAQSSNMSGLPNVPGLAGLDSPLVPQNGNNTAAPPPDTVITNAPPNSAPGAKPLPPQPPADYQTTTYSTPPGLATDQDLTNYATQFTEQDAAFNPTGILTGVMDTLLAPLSGFMNIVHDMIAGIFSAIIKPIFQIVGALMAMFIKNIMKPFTTYLMGILQWFVLNPNIPLAIDSGGAASNNQITGGQINPAALPQSMDPTLHNLQVFANQLRTVSLDLSLLIFIHSVWRTWFSASTSKGKDMMQPVGRLIFTILLMLTWRETYKYELMITNEMVKAIFFNSPIEFDLLNSALVDAMMAAIAAGGGAVASVFAPIVGAVAGSAVGPEGTVIGGAIGAIIGFIGLVMFIIFGGILVVQMCYLLVLKAVQTTILIAQYEFADLFLVFFASPDTEYIAKTYIKSFLEVSMWTFVWLGLFKIMVILLASQATWGKLLIVIGLLQLMISVPDFIGKAKISPASDLVNPGQIMSIMQSGMKVVQSAASGVVNAPTPAPLPVQGGIGGGAGGGGAGAGGGGPTLTPLPTSGGGGGGAPQNPNGPPVTPPPGPGQSGGATANINGPQAMPPPGPGRQGGVPQSPNGPPLTPAPGPGQTEIVPENQNGRPVTLLPGPGQPGGGTKNPNGPQATPPPGPGHRRGVTQNPNGPQGTPPPGPGQPGGGTENANGPEGTPPHGLGQSGGAPEHPDGSQLVPPPGLGQQGGVRQNPNGPPLRHGSNLKRLLDFLAGAPIPIGPSMTQSGAGHDDGVHQQIPDPAAPGFAQGGNQNLTTAPPQGRAGVATPPGALSAMAQQFGAYYQEVFRGRRTRQESTETGWQVATGNPATVLLGPGASPEDKALATMAAALVDEGDAGRGDAAWKAVQPPPPQNLQEAKQYASFKSLLYKSNNNDTNAGNTLGQMTDLVQLAGTMSYLSRGKYGTHNLVTDKLSEQLGPMDPAVTAKYTALEAGLQNPAVAAIDGPKQLNAAYAVGEYMQATGLSAQSVTPDTVRAATTVRDIDGTDSVRNNPARVDAVAKLMPDFGGNGKAALEGLNTWQIATQTQGQGQTAQAGPTAQRLTWEDGLQSYGPTAQPGPPGQPGPTAQPGPTSQHLQPGSMGQAGPTGQPGQIGQPDLTTQQMQQGPTAQQSPPAQQFQSGPTAQQGPPAQQFQSGPTVQQSPPAQQFQAGPTEQQGPPAQQFQAGPTEQQGPPAQQSRQGSDGDEHGQQTNWDQAVSSIRQLRLIGFKDLNPDIINAYLHLQANHEQPTRQSIMNYLYPPPTQPAKSPQQGSTNNPSGPFTSSGNPPIHGLPNAGTHGHEPPPSETWLG